MVVHVQIPNVLGFSFGVIQMVLYLIYKNSKKIVEENPMPELEIKIEEQNISELKEQIIIDVVKLGGIALDIIPFVAEENIIVAGDLKPCPEK